MQMLSVQFSKFWQLDACIITTQNTTEISIIPEDSLLLLPTLHLHRPRGDNFVFPPLTGFACLKFHRNGLIQHVPVHARLLSLSMMFLKFTQVVHINSLFLAIAAQYSMIWIFPFVWPVSCQWTPGLNLIRSLQEHIFSSLLGGIC